MESVMKIRRQILVDGRSIRSVSRETGLSRNTLRKYLTDEAPPRYRPCVYVCSIFMGDTAQNRYQGQPMQKS